jgi:glycosyltransferase involved in cell wall biosynthesis
MRVQIITKDNGWGLSRDMHLLRQTLIGISGTSMEVVCTDWQSKPTGKKEAFDLNIFLELLAPPFFREAKRNVYVPNPEWYFSGMWGAHLRRVDAIWAKTRDGEAIFSKMHGGVYFTGWTSHEMLKAGVECKHGPAMFLHAPGNSSAKGTKEVLEAFSIRPHLELTLISRRGWGALPRNVKHTDRLGTDEFREALNSHMVHLCPSSYEGFGHYINEARSVGAAIISTNAAPMNELVTEDFGLLAAVRSTSIQNAATHQHVDPFAIADLLDACMATPAHVLERIGARAREAYLREDQAFQDRLIQAIKDLQ